VGAACVLPESSSRSRCAALQAHAGDSSEHEALSQRGRLPSERLGRLRTARHRALGGDLVRCSRPNARGAGSRGFYVGPGTVHPPRVNCEAPHSDFPRRTPEAAGRTRLPTRTTPMCRPPKGAARARDCDPHRPLTYGRALEMIRRGLPYRFPVLPTARRSEQTRDGGAGCVGS
jgi:hypothetical protein